MAAERGEIIMPLLASLRFLAEGTRAVSRPSPTETHAFHMALDGACMPLQAAGLFEECMAMLGMADRSWPMCFTHQLPSPSCGGDGHGGGLVTMAQRGGKGHGPRLLDGFGHRRHHTPCDPRIRARQTVGIVSRGEGRGGFLCDQGCAPMVHQPFFFIGSRSSPFPWPCKRLTMRGLHTQLTQQDRDGRVGLSAYSVTGGGNFSRFYSILCSRGQ